MSQLCVNLSTACLSFEVLLITCLIVDNNFNNASSEVSDGKIVNTSGCPSSGLDPSEEFVSR